MYQDEPQGQGSGREDYLLRNWQCCSYSEFLNICVATGLAPNTGTPLPFVSYGLTSLVSLFIGMGLVMNVGLQSSTYNKELKRKEIDKKEEYL